MGVKIRKLILILLAAEGVAVLFKLIHVQHEQNVSYSPKASEEAFDKFMQRHQHSNICTAERNIANVPIVQSKKYYSVDCKALISGSEYEMEKAKTLVEETAKINEETQEKMLIRRFSRRFQDAGQAPVTPFKGHLHIVVNRKFVQFAVHDARARVLFDWAKKTRIPDEIFFSSLNRNPTLQIPGSYKYKDLKAPSEPFINRFKLRHVPCKGNKLRGVCLLGIAYLPELSNSSRLFANKFVWSYDNLSLHCLHQLLNNRTRDASMGLSSLDATWYSTLDFVVNKM